MTTLVQTTRSESKLTGYTYDLFMIMAGSLFIALFSQICIHLWFTPVPLTLQSFAIFLIGAGLGSKRGALAVIAYIAEGAVGMPVFAGGTSGLISLFGPEGGYFLGFILCAYAVGWLLENGWRESVKQTLFACAFGSAIILAIGAFWLSFYVGGDRAFSMGVAPFLIGALLKVGAASILIPSASKLVR